MDSFLNPGVDGLLAALGLFFKHRWAAPLVLAPLMLAAAGYIWWRADRNVRPYLAAVSARIAVIRGALGSDPDPIAEREGFSADYAAISGAMAKPGPGADELARAWHEFSESIISENETPIRNTTRPSAFFSRSMPRLTSLAFWANTFVGIGLLLTFLGIVVALDETAHGMAGDASIAQTKDALKGLLTIASAKFFSSIAGVGCSILLRFAERGMADKINARTGELCDLLERGLLYVPPQLLAVRQLDELQRQSAQFEKFNNDLAVQIGEQFQAAVQPLTLSLGSLNDNIGGMSDRLGEGVGKAIEGAASGELRALGHTLNALREQLEGLTSHVQGSGEEAARQIRAAGEDFAGAAKDIREAFGGLTGQVEGLGRRITEEAEANSNRQRELMDGAVAAFRSANDEAARGLRDSLEALQGAGAAAAAELRGRIGEAMAEAAQEADAALRKAIQEAGEGFAAAGEGLNVAVGRVAAEMLAVAEAMRRAEEGTAANAAHLTQTADGVRTVSTALNEAASGFAAAAAPVADAARGFREASERISTSLERAETANAQALREMGALATGVKETHAQAANAWTEYRTRFAEVDKALEKTVLEMSAALSGSLNDFRKFAQDIDSQMGTAIGRLAPAIESIGDSTSEIADFTQLLRSSQKVAAE